MLWIISLMLMTAPVGEPTSTEAVWMTDYEEAFVLAGKEKKYVLINFTGSDWCGWCKKLDREVFSTPEFKEYADKKLILLKLDFPRRTPQPRDVALRNQELARNFGVRGFPSIFIVSSRQKVLLRTGYQYGGAKAYIAHLESAINR